MRQVSHPAIWLFMLLAGLIAGCGSSQPSIAYVGVVFAANSDEEWQGIEIAADSFQGDRISPVFLRADPSDDRDAIAAEAERLRLVNKAVAIIGGRTAQHAEALARCGLPVISFATTFARAVRRRPFCIGLDPERQAIALAKFVREIKGNQGQVLILCDRRNPRHRKAAESFVKHIADEASRQSTGAQGIEYFSSGKELIERLEQIDPTQFRWCLVAADSSILAHFEKFKGSSATILFSGDPFDVPSKPAVPIVYATVWDMSFDLGANPAFVKKYEARFRRKPTLHSALAYDAAMILQQALERSTPPLAESLFDTLGEESPFRTTTGEATFDDRRILQRPVFLFRADPNGQRGRVMK